MNQHPLTADFQMYYSGTYVFRLINGVPHAMLVDGTERNGDDTQLEGVLFIGSVWDERNGLDVQQWPASEIDSIRPMSGYYNLNLNGDRRWYIQYSVNNRSQRKGFDSRNLIVDGEPNGLGGVKICRIYAQTLEMNSRPAHRDLWINGDKLHWKGTEVGTMTAGAFTAHEQFKSCEALICRLLQTI